MNNNIKVILAISVISNVLQAGYALRPQPSSQPLAEGQVSKTAVNASATAPRIDKQVVTNTVTKRITWEMVESGDYKEYIDNLRAIGCPEETIRDIILADVNKLYEQKKQTLRGGGGKFEYWKGGNPLLGAMDSGLMQKLKALEEEKLAVLRALGITPDGKAELARVVTPFDAMMDFLPEEKKTRVIKILTDKQSRMMEASKNGSDQEAMASAIKETEAALKASMTPEEFEDYQLRFSLTANLMRSQTAGFDPNEAEFMAVFKLREPFDNEFSPLTRGNENEEQRKIREDAEGKLKEGIKNAIGEERYIAYERAQDWNFQQIYQAAVKGELSAAEAVKVYDLKNYAEQGTMNVLKNQDLTQEQRVQMLQQLQQQTEASVKGILGEKGWDQYNRGINTHWIKNLNPIP
ncbi:MAG TPA: hypothetical protein VGH19_13460 [Verrucomicrobiae bacterium]